MNERLKKRNRLKKDNEFKKLLGSRLRLRRNGITLIIARNGLDSARLGLRVSKRTGNAVRRNYIKRCVREVFRRKLMERAAGYDLLVLVTTYSDFSTLKEQLSDMLKVLLKKAQGAEL